MGPRRSIFSCGAGVTSGANGARRSGLWGLSWFVVPMPGLISSGNSVFRRAACGASNDTSVAAAA
eukprot:2444399-Pleurochrysis_carterae.AAC.1